MQGRQILYQVQIEMSSCKYNYPATIQPSPIIIDPFVLFHKVFKLFQATDDRHRSCTNIKMFTKRLSSTSTRLWFSQLVYNITNYRNYKSVGIGFTKIKNCNLQVVADVCRGGHFLKPFYYTTIPLHQLISSF